MPCLFLALSIAGPVLAEGTATDLQGALPGFTFGDTLNCLAFQIAWLEVAASVAPTRDTKEMVFWSRLLAAKGWAEDAAGFDLRFDEALERFRATRSVFVSNPSDTEARDIADTDLTMIGKFCWFQALAVPGEG
ncbi:MAG: hypothetical protein C0524_10345 [Rhodobacter sp.]|nr:hypothetical protein [Rhodobacter sp.]